MDCMQCQGVFNQKQHTGLCFFSFYVPQNQFQMTNHNDWLLDHILPFVRECGQDQAIKEFL